MFPSSQDPELAGEFRQLFIPDKQILRIERPARFPMPLQHQSGNIDLLFAVQAATSAFEISSVRCQRYPRRCLLSPATRKK